MDRCTRHKKINTEAVFSAFSFLSFILRYIIFSERRFSGRRICWLFHSHTQPFHLHAFSTLRALIKYSFCKNPRLHNGDMCSFREDEREKEGEREKQVHIRILLNTLHASWTPDAQKCIFFHCQSDFRGDCIIQLQELR